MKIDTTTSDYVINWIKNDFDCKDKRSNRLPCEIQPLNYKILLDPYFNDFEFYGNVVI